MASRTPRFASAFNVAIMVWWLSASAFLLISSCKWSAGSPVRPRISVISATRPGWLPVMAHIEFTMREFCWDGITRLSLSATRRYFKRPEVLAEFDACVAKWRAAGPSGLGNAMICRHWQALGYTMAGRRPEAKATFDEIGPYLGSSHVWGYYYPSASQGFLECRR